MIFPSEITGQRNWLQPAKGR